ncbi:MAG: hypothetical protein F7C81_04525 [Desulfurococcales archaeon]|nr:hypothetical protein [Desulfurococcales archaeon]MEB3779930.1 hypothetical protein [Desulfurococcales archaeon]
MDPIDKAFQDVIQEVYWSEPLEEAEEILREKLETMDEDLRELLLKRRREFCNNPSAVVEVIRLEAAAEAAETELMSRILLARSLIGAGFLMQCTEKWANIDAKTKASILAPLYKAAYGLDLATRRWPESIDEVHLDYAIKMLDKALERAEEHGIIAELRKFIEKTAEKLVR